LLVIDAKEGVQENSRRHGYMISMLGIKQMAVIVNKMDLVDYSREVFDAIVEEYSCFLNDIGIQPSCFIPVSGMKGDTVAAHMDNMKWYNGSTVLQVLDSFIKEKSPVAKPFRMPVQGVYKFTNFNDSRRIIAGTIDTGSIHVGDEIVFYPSGKKSRVKSIEGFNQPERLSIEAGYATGFTTEEQIYVSRGEIAAKGGEEPPKVTTRLLVNLFWLGKKPLSTKKEYILKVGTAKIPMRVEEVVRVLDASDLEASEQKDRVDRHDVAECILKCNRAVAFDYATDMPTTGRFVIVDDYEIWGGGIIREALDDSQAWVRDKVYLRNYKWEKSIIPFDERAEKYNQKSTMVLITGKQNAGKKPIAKGLEARLFRDGKIVYFLGIGNVLYGVDADIKGENNRKEHIRRLSEVANIMLDAGMILLVTAIELTQDDLENIKTIISPDKIEVVWVGDEVTTDIGVDTHIHDELSIDDAVDKIKNLLQEKGVIFRPW